MRKAGPDTLRREKMLTVMFRPTSIRGDPSLIPAQIELRIGAEVPFKFERIFGGGGIERDRTSRV